MPEGPSTEQFGGRFELIERIGAGGMATVWLARDLRLRRMVAIKRLHPHIADNPGASDRFTREALSVAALSHPAIVVVYDVGEDDDGPFMVMEYVEGRTLAQYLADEGRPPTKEAIKIALLCAESLAHAHERGVIHRDVKPANILLAVDGSVKLADFGIAKAAWDNKRLTETAVMLGTATYLSPEQVKGGEASPATDQYSLGVVLYEMLTGQVPFPADNPVAAAIAHATLKPRPPSELCKLPADLETIVLRCLEKDPADRFPDAQSLASALVEVDTHLLPTEDLPPILLPTIDDDSPTPQLATRPRLSSTRQREGSRTPLVVTGAVTGVVALIALLIWGLSDPGTGAGSLDTTLISPTVAETQTATSAIDTTTTIDPSTTLPPATVAEALEALSAYLQSIPAGDGISADLKRDLEKRLIEVTAEWNKDRKVDKTIEKLDQFVARISEQRNNSGIDSEPADGLIKTTQQALALLTAGDIEDD